jgi:sugar phosphate isomerase/epimerase
METFFLCPRWGSESLAPREFIKRVIKAGYDGVEVALADGDSEAEQAIALAKSEGLVVVTQHFQTLDTDPAKHLEAFESRLRRAASFGPLFINSHTGRDLFDLETNISIFDVADRIAADTGVPVFHETHRGRCFHSPWRMAEFLTVRPETRLVFDMSHWCVVCESLCVDQKDVIKAILPAVSHIHARVGHAQGPQVPDPRAPEWQEALEIHVSWWKKIAALRAEEGRTTLTITPEFGPPP